jgi:gluconokinase
MGVSGTGKTSVGERLAAILGAQFLEGDAYHSDANIAKMNAGVPLDDDDRLPWLGTLARLVTAWDDDEMSTVVTCSALRRRYRDVLRAAVPAPRLVFVHLHAPYDVLADRMSRRTGHFMPPSLLRSQFDTLEPLEPDESGIVLDVSSALDDVMAAALAAVRTGDDPGARPGR